MQPFLPLILIGSVYPLVAEQVEELLNKTDTHFSFLDTCEVIKCEEYRKKEIGRIIHDITTCDEAKFAYIVIGNGIFPGKKMDLISPDVEIRLRNREISRQICNSFGEIACELLKVKDYEPILTCGGEISLEVARSLGVKAFRILGEIEPLVVFSKLIGGKYEGKSFITKGGAVGSKKCLINAIEYSKNQR
jgi:D-threonate/D-erythronate kinase